MTEVTQETTEHTAQPAPGELELVRGFVNTYDAEVDREELDSADALAEWLRGNGLLASDEAARPADLQAAIELREALRSLLLSNHGEPTDPAAIERLHRAAKAADLRVQVRPDSTSTTRSGEGGLAGAHGTILAVVHAAMADGTWERLKVCPADDCLWAFYDRSRNRSRRWCDMEICGNRAKVRSYRERRGAQTG